MAERVQRTCIKLTAVRTPARGGGARLRSAGLSNRWRRRMAMPKMTDEHATITGSIGDVAVVLDVATKATKANSTVLVSAIVD